MQKLFLVIIILISNILFSQDYQRRVKYLDSIVSRADTIFLVFTKEINYIQSDVPIYDSQIDLNKFKEHDKKYYDTLKSSKVIYKNLPTESESKGFNGILKKKKSLIFENDEFRMYNQYQSKKIIGYEKRICLNSNNRISQNTCSVDSNYNYIFYHSYIRPQYIKKYIDYIRFRDLSFKSYNVRYSGYSPNIESGAIEFTGTKVFSSGNNNLLFFIDDLYENIKGKQTKRIALPYLNAILKENKVYFIKTSTDVNSEEQIFEEVKYQKFVTDA